MYSVILCMYKVTQSRSFRCDFRIEIFLACEYYYVLNNFRDLINVTSSHVLTTLHGNIYWFTIHNVQSNLLSLMSGTTYVWTDHVILVSSQLKLTPKYSNSTRTENNARVRGIRTYEYWNATTWSNDIMNTFLNHSVLLHINL